MRIKANCYIITVSDTRTATTDKSGNLIAEFVQKAGHHVIEQRMTPDDMAKLESELSAATQHLLTDVVLLTGGTGIAQRDITIEVIEGQLEKEIPGFGEIFRMLSFTEDIGSAAILSRATAGVINGKAVFAMPGSTGAVRLAMTKLIIPELPHIVSELRK